MKQVLIKQGGVVVEDVPAPQVEPGCVLIKLAFSCISVGTEMSGVKTSSMPLWKRAMKSPGDVKKVVDRARSHGIKETRALVERKLQTAHPLGYSASGLVIGVGPGVEDIEVGDRVACAGSQSAFHAEVVSVPRNLVTLLPDALAFEDGALVTLGAIAMQGVRRAEPTLGETFIVVGLGILGQLTQQLLRANGVKVIGTDISAERVALAKSTGMAFGFDATDDVIGHAHRLTDGYGADGVIITAATPSDEVLSQAFKACRRKGRVVLVGDVGMDIQRQDIYAKELDFRISTSYGPGRYDHVYEEQGLDYPLPYVRWTENRNMAAFLDLAASGAVDVKPLVSGIYAIDDAPKAYEALKSERDRPLSLLLSYPDSGAAPTSRIVLNTAAKGRDGAVRIAVVGAGGFAVNTLMPIMAELRDDYVIASVVTRQGHNAMNVARQFGVAEATTDFNVVLNNPDIDAVLIATRHHLHGDMVLAALQAGKHVMVEKPLCLTRDELKRIEDFYKQAGEGAPIVMTGFNRRFSPYAQTITEALTNRSGPMMVNYRVNAGHLPKDNWVHGEQGGGRNLGEACHFYDLFTALTGSQVVSVDAQAIDAGSGHFMRTDNFVATARFADGSLATLTYTALGASQHPKERMTVYVDGAVIEVEDYRAMTVAGSKLKPLTTPKMEKGHREELMAFAKAVRHGGAWPIALWQQVQATAMALDVQDQIANPGSAND